MQITTLDYKDYVGRIGIGRKFRGNLRLSDDLVIIKGNGDIHKIKPKQLFVFEGLQRVEVEEVKCGDICAIVGIEDIDIGDTISDELKPEPLPIISNNEPTISMTFQLTIPHSME